MSEDAGNEPRTVATLALQTDALTTRLDLIHYSVKSHPHSTRSHPHSARSRPCRPDLMRSLMDILFLSLTNVLLLICGHFPKLDFSADFSIPIS